MVRYFTGEWRYDGLRQFQQTGENLMKRTCLIFMIRNKLIPSLFMKGNNMNANKLKL